MHLTDSLITAKHESKHALKRKCAFYSAVNHAQCLYPPSCIIFYVGPYGVSHTSGPMACMGTSAKKVETWTDEIYARVRQAEIKQIQQAVKKTLFEKKKRIIDTMCFH